MMMDGSRGSPEWQSPFGQQRSFSIEARLLTTRSLAVPSNEPETLNVAVRVYQIPESKIKRKVELRRREISHCAGRHVLRSERERRMRRAAPFEMTGAGSRKENALACSVRNDGQRRREEKGRAAPFEMTVWWVEGPGKRIEPTAGGASGWRGSGLEAGAEVVPVRVKGFDQGDFF